MASERPTETLRLRLCPDALLRRACDTWIATNPRTHTHVELDSATMSAIGVLGGGASEAAWGRVLASAKGWDRSGYEFPYGLWSDPSRLVARHTDAARG